MREKGSDGELALAVQLREAGIEFYREVAFYAGRRWRLDFVLPLYADNRDLAIEVQGGNWSRGRHTRASSLEDEYEKIAAATFAGYHVVICSTQQAKDGTVLRWLTEGSDAFDKPRRRRPNNLRESVVRNRRVA